MLAGVMRSATMAARSPRSHTPMGGLKPRLGRVERLCLTGDFLVTNVDTWLGTGFNEISKNIAPSMAVVQVKDASRYGRVQLDEQSNIILFHEKSSEIQAGWINAGLYYLDVQLFRDLNHAPPFSLEQTIFPRLAAANKLKAIALDTDFIDIGIPSDYQKFCDFALTQKSS